jgi:uncharacterized membrane protein
MKALASALILVAGLTAAAEAGPISAGLTLCNRTSYVLYAATAAVSGPDATVKGWTRVVPGACAEAIKEPLTAQSYYLYAKTSRAHAGPQRAWGGPSTYCVKDKDFTGRGPASARCNGDAHGEGFAPLDTHHMQRWTATLRDTPDLVGMDVAERAGLQRLLADTGVRNLTSDKAVDAALMKFKARVHLANGAPTAALFDALETEAMKSAVPNGYTLCNDTGGEVYAAIGQQMVSLKGVVYAARGWWTVAGGTCAQLMSDSVANKKIWLRVERAKGAPLVQGPAKFCVTTIEFEIQGRERCAARGLTEAGFAQTHGGPAAGFTAHVGAQGLTAAPGK